MRRIYGDLSPLTYQLGTENPSDNLSTVNTVECRATLGKRVIQNWVAWTVDTAATLTVDVSFEPTEPWPVGKIKLVFRVPIGGGKYRKFPNDDPAELEITDLN